MADLNKIKNVDLNKVNVKATTLRRYDRPQQG